MKCSLIASIFLISISTYALPKEEIEATCKEASRPVLAVQREMAISHCIEFAGDVCERMERSLRQTCIETSPSDQAIAYDMSRGTAGACEAGLIKRNTQQEFCDGLKKECRDTKIPMGGGGATATCKLFRDEDNRKICAEIDRHAARVTELYAQEKKKCASLNPKKN